MPFQERSAILNEIGAELQAGVLAYVTGDRENLEVDVGADVLRQVPRHLEALGKQDRLALVLYTLGGDTNTPWPFVNFLRAYCDQLFVLVPFWAHSAGTLIALGADKIYMTRFGTLSPVDPSVTNEFNPYDPASPSDRIPIAVEDVLAFFQLASEQGENDADLAGDAFRRLAESVHPLALGNVKRSIEQIWQLSKKLIRLHTPDVDDEELTPLVMRLTTELYSHSHLVTRTEAAALGLPVEQPSEGVEDRLLAYYEQLKTDLELLEKFDPDAMLQQQPQLPVVLERAYIETPTTCDSFVTRGVISPQPQARRRQQADTTPATLEVTSERWETIA
jgi:pimeloyl-ACP methyl ester carboxylesterase